MGSRATSGSRVNADKAENVREKQKAPTMGSRAASGSRVNTNKAENVRKKQKHLQWVLELLLVQELTRKAKSTYNGF